MKINSINDLTAAYEQQPIALDDGFKCPVCGIVRKRESTIKKHMESQDCYRLVDLFKGTQTETSAYLTYKQLGVMRLQKTPATIKGFRKSPLYNGCTKFVLFCNQNELPSSKNRRTVYLDWLVEFKGCKQEQQLLSYAIKETNLRAFRVFLQQNHETYIDSDVFYQRYYQDLLNDRTFLVRSIEKAHISLVFLALQNDFPFGEIMDSLPEDMTERLIEIRDACSK